MDDTVVSNHVYEDPRYLDPRLLREGYEQQLQRLEQGHTCYNDDEGRLPARDWIMAKQMMSCAFLQRITTDQKFLVRKSKKLSSNFVLRPSKVEGTPSQMNRDSYGFKGLLSRNTSANYVNTSSRRKKLAVCFNWNQVKNPELELKLRRKWIQENKTNEFKDPNSAENTQNLDSSVNVLPELNSDLKKVYGSPIFVAPFHKTKKPSSSNFQPTVTGVQLHSHSENAPKEPGESASGDNVTPSRIAVWKKFRGLHNKPLDRKENKTENKKLQIKKTQKESKQTSCEFTDISDPVEEKNPETKKSIFGKKTLVEVFTPIAKALSSSSRSSSAETYRTFRKSSNQVHTSESSSSLEASSPVHHCSDIDNNDTYKLSAAKIFSNINQTYFNEGNLIPATSLGPVKSKMNDRSNKNSVENEVRSIRDSGNGSKKPTAPSSQSNSYKLPSLLQNGLKRLSLTLDEADDEASTHRRGTTDEHCAAHHHSRNLDPKDAVTSSSGNKRKKRLRSKERKRTLDIDAKDSSSVMLPEQEKKRKPRRKRKPRKNIDGTTKPHETIGSEGDDEWEDDSDDYGGQDETL